MIRRPPRSTQGVSSAASDVYKRQVGIVFLLLGYSLCTELLVTREYTDYLKKHAPYEVVDYEDNIFKGWTVEDARGMQESDIVNHYDIPIENYKGCLLYTSPSPRDLSTSRMPSSA
eukprot:TRINITY_DN15996_c0_g1_i3.p3 TRINITY_DN15996_c0_g1~~TRINITY_DN15996_c0_g1_i3.p3  ORF type:complete len:116 (-),score=28.32 TRINITY_DN15996_c0_g1_i3:106-453(-)